MAVPKKIINPAEQTKALYGAGDRPPKDILSPFSALAGEFYLK